jgi:hypothetical protein
MRQKQWGDTRYKKVEGGSVVHSRQITWGMAAIIIFGNWDMALALSQRRARVVIE